jgi:hypothetical protein
VTSFPLGSLQFDQVTVEPFTAESSARAQSVGTAVTYRAQISRGARRIWSEKAGREVISNVQVIISSRVHIDQRSRVTLPAGFVPQTPPIIGIEPMTGLGLAHTVIYL